MLTATTLPLAAVAVLASSASAHYYPPSSSHGHVAARSFHHHSNRAFFPARPALNSLHKKRSARTRRGEPESLMPGTLTSSEGCTQYAHVESGDWCIKVVDAIDGMTLDKFYEMNPQIDADCQNLWAGYDVCVSNTAAKVDSTAKVSTSDAPRTTTTVEKKPVAPQTTTSSKAPESTTTSFAKVPPVKVAAVKTSSSTTTTDAPKPTTTTTTSAAPAQTSAAAAAQEESEGDSEDDDWVCDDEEESSSSSSAAPAATSAAVQLNQKPQQQEQQQEWTSAAPTTTITSQWVAPTTTTTTSQAPAVTKVADTSSANVLAASGIKNFLGVNSNAILSWYNTNSGQDSTNGRGWCEFNYNNAMPGFAPSLKTMLANFNGDSVAAKKAYCGLEAKITSADGKSITAYIIDAFDDTKIYFPCSLLPTRPNSASFAVYSWVRTPSSLDLTVDTFTSIFGRWTDNKNDVLQQASWEFTGKRRDDFVYRSSQYQ